MRIDNWHRLAVLTNFAFFVMMVIFCFITRFEVDYDLEDQILLLLFREGIILIIQIGWNLLLYAIPKFFPRPEPKEPK